MTAWIRRRVRAIAITLMQRLYVFMHEAVESQLPQFANRPLQLRIELPRRIYDSEYMHIGDNVHIGPNSLLIAQTHYPPETMRHPSNATPPQRFTPKIVIGHRVSSTGGLILGAMCEIVIDDDVMFAANVLVSDGLHGFASVDVPYKYQKMWRIAPVHIKRGCWIGQNVVILPGVTIGELSIIGANSVVTQSIPPRTIAVGNPARVIKRWDPVSRSWQPASERVMQSEANYV